MIDARAVAFLALILPWQSACAHDLAGEASWQAGFVHPFSGPDHLIAMVAVGMISVVLGGRAIWTVPVSFVLALPVGAAAGYWGLPLQHAEFGVAASVVVLGTALAVRSLAQLTPIVFIAVVFFGLCHGFAHGIEMPRTASPARFSVGFMSASVFLHIAGLFMAEVLSAGPVQVRLRQAIGVAMAIAGIWMIPAHASA